MKSDKNFRMSKPSKVLFALTKGSKEQRSFVKNSMIDAEVTEIIAKKQMLKSKAKDLD